MDQTTSQPVRHLIAVRFKPDASQEDIRLFTDEFRALQERIPGITSFEYGPNHSPEGLNHGFTHVFLMTLESAAARDAYLPHPEHRKFGELLGQLNIIEDLLVVDFTP